MIRLTVTEKALTAGARAAAMAMTEVRVNCILKFWEARSAGGKSKRSTRRTVGVFEVEVGVSCLRFEDRVG